MILVKTMDGKVHIADNWGMSKFGSDIQSVFLTDGDKITHNLKACDGYLVDREKVVTQPDGSRRINRIVKETVYGFKNLDENKQVLSDEYLGELKALKAKYGHKPDYNDRVTRLNNLYQRLLGTIEDKEVSFITLEQTEGTMKKAQLPVSFHPNHVKPGVSNSISNIKLLGKRYWHQLN